MRIFELVSCPSCRGAEEKLFKVKDNDGNEQFVGMQNCQKCGGSGWRHTVLTQKIKSYFYWKRTCSECLGKSVFVELENGKNLNCPSCNGSGKNYTFNQLREKLMMKFYCFKCEGEGVVPVSIFEPGLNDLWKLRLSKRHPQLKNMSDIPRMSPSLIRPKNPITETCPRCGGCGRARNILKLFKTIKNAPQNIKSKIKSSINYSLKIISSTS